MNLTISDSNHLLGQFNGKLNINRVTPDDEKQP